MLYENDYNGLFEGSVNADPEDFEEEEKMEETKTFKEKVKEFANENPFFTTFMVVGGCVITGLVLGLRKQRIYNRGFHEGWLACGKYFDDVEAVVRRNLLTKNE